MELTYSSISDVGNVRTNNEDCLLAGELKTGTYIFIVADGMGGHNAGEVASYMAVSTFAKSIKKGIGPNIPKALETIVLNINEIILKEGKKVPNDKGMGTTLSALYIKDSNAYIAHVGDSRIYQYSKPVLRQLTEDHSLVGKLLKDGFITTEEAQKHPKRNVLYQSVGLKPSIMVQTAGPIPINNGDKFILCSDGLNNEVKDSKIREFLAMRSTKDIVDGLLHVAKNGAASDNITIIAVSTEKDYNRTMEDTLKITAIEIPTPLKKRRNRKVGLFIILGILIGLLAVVMYILVDDSNQSPISKNGTYGINNTIPKVKSWLER